MKLAAPALLLTLALQAVPQNPPAAPANPPQQAAPPVQQAPPASTQEGGSTPGPSFTVVIDPGHGGADAGARGSSGVLEKDVVMGLAQLLRATLEKRGARVVLTRQADGNPSYDERAATANAYRGAIVITLHASSTGATGAARAYYQAASPEPGPPLKGPVPDSARAEPAMPRPIGLVRWEEAQQGYLVASKRLAENIQAQIRQQLENSPATAGEGNLRDLRSIFGPAVAVELASVSVKERRALEPYLAPLAEAISRGVANFKAQTASRGETP